MEIPMGSWAAPWLLERRRHSSAARALQARAPMAAARAQPRAQSSTRILPAVRAAPPEARLRPRITVRAAGRRPPPRAVTPDPEVVAPLALWPRVPGLAL